MKNTFKRTRLFFIKSFQRFSEMLYVPSQTGSHDVGEQYMGDVASTYVDHKNFPEYYCLSRSRKTNSVYFLSKG